MGLMLICPEAGTGSKEQAHIARNKGKIYSEHGLAVTCHRIVLHYDPFTFLEIYF